MERLEIWAPSVVKKQEKWDHDRWIRRLEKCPYGGFVYSSGLTKWGDIIGPAQEAYWDLIDTQRACGIIAATSKMAIQVHLDKASGGVRLLTMLEDSFKAIEGPVARRKTEARRSWPDGTVYQPFNLAGEVSKRAAPEVLYIDELVCEDVMEYNMEFSRTPTD